MFPLEKKHMVSICFHVDLPKFQTSFTTRRPLRQARPRQSGPLRGLRAASPRGAAAAAGGHAAGVLPGGDGAARGVVEMAVPGTWSEGMMLGMIILGGSSHLEGWVSSP